MNEKLLNDTSSGTVGLLLSRRSGSAKSMEGPGPNAAEIEIMLLAATRVPDHGKLAPWRFILFEGDARIHIGEILAKCVSEEDPQASAERLRMERERFQRAPLVVGVISRVREGIAIPEWEQVLSAGAACQNLVLAAHAQGYVANWITEWCAYHPAVRESMGLKSGERVAGFIHIGRPAMPLEDRPRPDLNVLMTRFGA